MNKIKELWTGKKKLVVKVIAGVVTVAVVGTGIGFGAVQAKSGKKETTVAAKDNTADEKEEAGDDQADLLTNIIKSQVGGDTSDVGKEENVYVISDASGASQEVIVSDWLKNPKAADILQDASNLTDIKNVKGDETYKEGKDGQITWQADGSDIYYQGTSDAELPVDVKITYFLDGKEMKPEDMAGKSGKVTIRFDYKNKQKETVKVGNKDEEVYVPFTVMSAMMLPTDTFSDVTVTNGKVMSEGLNNIVMGLAFPGLQDSLQIDDKKLKDKDIEIPDYVEVNAVTSDFSLDMTLSVVLSDALSDIHLTDSIDLSDLDSSMDKLTDASGELQNGTKQLKEGVDTLNEKTGEFQDGAKKLSDGITAYTDGVATLDTGIATLKDGAGQLKSGAATLSSGASELNSKVQEINFPSVSLSDEQLGALKAGVDADSTGALAAGASQLSGGIVQALNGSIIAENVAGGMQEAGAYDQIRAASGMSVEQLPDTVIAAIIRQTVNAVNSSISNSAGTIEGACKRALTSAAENGAVGGGQAVAAQVNSSLSSYAGMISQLKDGTKKIADGASQLESGINTLDSGADQLKSGADTLVANTQPLKDGVAKLYNGTTQLADGVSKLQTGATDLNDGMIQFDKDGIKKLTSAFEGDGKKVLDRLNATMDAGHDYHTFTELPDDVDGSVKFIIRTDAIK